MQDFTEIQKSPFLKWKEGGEEKKRENASSK